MTTSCCQRDWSSADMFTGCTTLMAAPLARISGSAKPSAPGIASLPEVESSHTTLRARLPMIGWPTNTRSHRSGLQVRPVIIASSSLAF